MSTAADIDTNITCGRGVSTGCAVTWAAGRRTGRLSARTVRCRAGPRSPGAHGPVPTRGDRRGVPDLRLVVRGRPGYFRPDAGSGARPRPEALRWRCSRRVWPACAGESVGTHPAWGAGCPTALEASVSPRPTRTVRR